MVWIQIKDKELATIAKKLNDAVADKRNLLAICAIENDDGVVKMSRVTNYSESEVLFCLSHLVIDGIPANHFLTVDTWIDKFASTLKKIVMTKDLLELGAPSEVISAVVSSLDKSVGD